MCAETTWRQSAEGGSRVRQKPKAAPTEDFGAAWDKLAEAVRITAGARGLENAEVELHLDILQHAIRQACEDTSPNLGALPSYVPARRLLDELHFRFLELADAAPPLSSGTLLAVLRAMERVRSALEADAAQRLATSVPEPEALELVVAVAHDMRSPLTSVLLLIDALRKGHSGPITPHQERQLQLVYGAAFGLSNLASDLLDLARGGDRLLDPVAIPFSITECLNVVRDIVQPIAEEKKLDVRLTTPKNGDRRVGQPVALTRVLLNLVTNALKFTHQGHVSISVIEVSRTVVEFSVSDTGCGIPAEIVETLFDAFRRQSQSGRTVFSSAGLGLSVCEKLVAAMGGTLAVQSTLGERTCFSFRLSLPLARRI